MTEELTYDTGDTGFMIVAASLVALMTPGLAFFYGGLVSRKNVLVIMFQSFVSMGITDIIWWIYGYSLAFSSDKTGGFIGDLNKAFLIGVKPEDIWPGTRIPEYVFFVYQMMFAIITPALITGAFANRIHFKAYVIFLVAWLTFVYVPWCHWIWGGGFLAKWGVLDFAGGIVVHATAGFASLASVYFVGARAVRESEPHSVPLVALGTGLLWFGWYGFNAGSALSASSTTALAFFNTDLAGSFAAVTWLVMEWAFAKKPKFIGLLTGAVAGLATITPGAGYIPPWAACIEGILAAIVCYFAVWFKNKMKWDDALDVWGVHGVGGILGTILLGCFGSTEYNPLGADGLFFGGGAFFGKQIAAVVFACVWGFVFTYGMLWLINKVTPVKVSEEIQDNLDQAELGEKAYVKPGGVFVQRTDSTL